MTDGRQRQPAIDETPHAVPKDAAILAALRQRAVPEASHLEPKEKQRRLVPGHSVVADVSARHRLQPIYPVQEWAYACVSTRPACSPANASTLPLRAAPHDSGPMWVASSHSYDFCIHYTSPA
jgi:hypothetical protein